MKRYIITSEKFTGQVELLYKERDGLMLINKIDLSGSNCSAAQIVRIVQAAPVLASAIDSAYRALPVTIVEAEIIVTLEDFKHEYPYARNMHLLPPVWDKMPQTDKILAVTAAKEYRKYCERNQQWYKAKIAKAWLTGKEYLNDWKKL